MSGNPNNRAPQPGLNDSIRQAKLFLRDHYKEGTTCPCCGQRVKLYPRTVTSAMAMGLTILYRYDQSYSGRYVHIEDHLKAIPGLPSSIRGDIAKLGKVELIEPMEGRRADGSKRVGLWRITEHGRNFIEGRVKVAKYFYIYNDQVQGYSPEQIGIEDAYRNKFRFDEIMADARLAPGREYTESFDDSDTPGKPNAEDQDDDNDQPGDDDMDPA